MTATHLYFPNAPVLWAASEQATGPIVFEWTDGEVTEMILDQPNGTFTAEKQTP